MRSIYLIASADAAVPPILLMYYGLSMSETRRGKHTKRARPQKNKRSARRKVEPRRRILSGKTRAALFRVFKVAVLCFVVACLSFLAGGYLGLVRTVQSLEPPSDVTTRPTYIYSSPIGETEGSRRVIGTIFQGQNWRTASLEEMPPQLLNAVVAQEDVRFRAHGGVDLLGIMRALYVDIRAGAAVEGASTITQQYVRNAYLSQERTLSRKVKEALIALEVERVQEKDEILGNYLNAVYFGSNAYGIEAASETYFNKSTEDLSPGEAATLVGLLQAPTRFAADRALATEQRDIVLEHMFDAGYITKQDYNEARKERLPERWPANPMMETGLTGPALTRDFTAMVEEELVNRYGAGTVVRGGLSVYTTLDLEAQVTAQEILYGQDGYLSAPQAPDAALVSIEPGSGKIRSVVGSRNENSQFNLATQAQRQPGSSFKPFALIAALEQGVDPKAKFVSERKTYDVKRPDGTTEKWKVQNYGKVERGSITLQEALWQSDNTVFADLVMNAGGKGLENGPRSVVDVAERLGITADYKEHPPPSVVLGTQEVSPMEMATAYATIANEGRRVEPTGITKVTQDQGQGEEKVLYEATGNPEGKQVIDPEIARKSTELMTGDITRGIATKASLGKQPAAGKTGTSENYFDGWFIGFTPQLATSVWMGYAEGGRTLESLLGPESQQFGFVGSPTVIWQQYMESVLQGEKVQDFEGVEPVEPVSQNATQPPDRPRAESRRRSSSATDPERR